MLVDVKKTMLIIDMGMGLDVLMLSIVEDMAAAVLEVGMEVVEVVIADMSMSILANVLMAQP